ncbi:hypothetical protein V2J09_021713 [Rumex salicifolius]
MAMNSSSSASSIVAAIILLQLLFIYPSAATPKDVFFQEMTRLGSMPPSCYNKCNKCHPCMAVQVAAQTGITPVQSRPGSRGDKDKLGLPDSMAASTNSNYKPLGWKCMCKDHFFNP